MDAGEYETNTLLINNLACIAFRIYEPVASQSSTYTFNASDVERDLRSNGYLVYMDAVRRGIWCFYLVGKNPSSVVPPEQYGLAAKLEVCGYTLGLVEEGSFEPISLLKGRLPSAHPIKTPSSSSSTGSAMDMSGRGAQGYNTPQPGVPSSGSPAPTDPKIFSGMMPDTKGYSSIPIQEVHSFFITATLSSLTTSFCHQTGAVALNHRTVLLPPQAFQTDDGEAPELLRTSALATIRVYLTTTGSLVISLYVSLLRGLVSSAEALGSSLLPASTYVLAAPLGAFGAIQGIVDAESHVTDHGFGQSPDTQISRSWPDSGDKFSQWKSTCSMLLRLGGMSPSLLERCAWLNIHFLQRKPFEQRADGKRTPISSLGPTAPWPSVLCFRKPKVEAIFESRLVKEALTTGGDEIDPLIFAMNWLKDVPEREKQLQGRAKERQAAAETRSNADGDTRNNATSHFSPLTMRRSSNGGPAPAVGAMYPTPPDGVQQHGMATTFDGTVLSPEVHAARATIVGDADATLNRPPLTGNGFDDGWSGNELKREQPGVGFLEGENIYGDLGDNLFEGNELTDADFDFFGEGQSGGDLDMVMSNMGSSMDATAGLGQATDLSTYPIKMERDDDSRPSAPEFAKPELKHARSTLAEESRQLTNLASSHANSAVGIRGHTSPFNAETVYETIRALSRPLPRATKATNSSSQRRRSAFGRIVFNPSLSRTSMKYQGSGRFHYTIPDDKNKESQSLHSFSAVSPVSLPGPATTIKSRKDLPAPLGLLLSGVAGVSAGSPAKRDDGLVSDSSESDSSSDDEGVNYLAGGLSSPAKSSVVKRRPDDDVISMAASFKDLENTSADSPGYGHIDLSRLSVPDVPELSLTKYFADPEPSPTPPRLLSSSHDFVAVAQILTAQAASGSLKLYPTSTFSELLDTRRSLIKAIRYSAQGLRKAIPRSLAGAVECQLRPLIDVQDVPLLAPPTRLQARPPVQEPRPPIFPIASPHLELRRYETQLSVLPSAISFWESLGLGPSRGPKDVVSICVVPYQPGRRENVVDFVERVRSMYESLKLGSFDPLPSTNSVVDGVVTFVPELDATSPGSAMSGGSSSALSERLEALAKTLAFSTLTDKNFVIFFPYAPESPSSIVESCAAFLDLFGAFKQCMADHRRPVVNELVLQLIPLDAIASETSIAVLTQSESARLCLEVYDRCTLFGGPMPAPAILLEPLLPKQVEFRVTTAPSPDILHENSCIHIAYAQSVDDRWISAAWTDNQGYKQHTASYCLGMRGRRLSTPVADVLYEIWDTTSDFISSCKVHWRVIITKCGPMDQQEADLWTQFAHAEPKGAVSLVLMTVDTNPSLQLIPPSIRVPLNTPSVFYTTPASTPQASSILSPDQSGNQPAMGMNPTTPGGGDGIASSDMPDADATLVDILDTTWGAVLSHRLNNSTSLTELNPSLASGYLIKRCGPRAEDALVAMEVNIVHMEGSPRGFEVLLREMLGNFRALGTLARARGVVDREGDVRPWHVAAAEKAVRALSQLM